MEYNGSIGNCNQQTQLKKRYLWEEIEYVQVCLSECDQPQRIKLF